MEIRDPIHGPIEVSTLERDVIDHPLVQRLRRIRQLGFAEATFPGATHTRFIHSIGAMHLAGLAFDAVARDLQGLEGGDLLRLRTTVRLAALLHDLGHPPLSHTGEAILPRLGFLPGGDKINESPATHEDLTRSLILHSDISDLIATRFGHLGLIPEHIVAVLCPGAVTTDSDVFTVGGHNALFLFHDLIAGELDVDRMDYLLRDSYFTGVSYGHFEMDWILSHLGAEIKGDRWEVALDGRALFAFEDFLLSRRHMFLQVYYHYRTVAYHEVLGRYLRDCTPPLVIDTTLESFIECDDEWLMKRVRSSDHPAAVRIIKGRPPSLVLEVLDDEAARLAAIRFKLNEVLPAGCTWVDSAVPLSHHVPDARTLSRRNASLLIRQNRPGLSGRTLPVHEVSGLYSRHSVATRVLRLYCDDRSQVDQAKASIGAALDSMVANTPELPFGDSDKWSLNGRIR